MNENSGMIASGIIVNSCDHSANPKILQHLLDIDNLTEGKLKKRYPKEFNSWKNRRDYAHKTGIPFYSPWEIFSNFLKDLGPIPKVGYTLDNIDRKSGYIPGNVRWASKQEQAWNRKTTVWLTHQGKKQPLSVWAKETNQAESTLRNRKSKGWDDESVITGVPPKKAYKAPFDHPWPSSHVDYWEKRYREEHGEEHRVMFLYKESDKKLKYLYECANEIWDCLSEYPPVGEEKFKLDELGKVIELWQGFHKRAKQVIESIKKT